MPTIDHLLDRVCEIHRRVVSGVDGLRNQTYAVEVDAGVPCCVQQRSETEILATQTTDESTWWGFFPAGTKIGHDDSVVLADGREFRVTGRPRRPDGHLAGPIEHHVEVPLALIEG